jgi:hypothetical protein
MITNILLAFVVLLQLATLAQSLRGHGLTRRMRRRDEYAARAVAYAEQLGGDSHTKLKHAVQCFEKLDLADNKLRDFTDIEAGIAIHAALGGKN